MTGLGCIIVDAAVFLKGWRRLSLFRKKSRPAAEPAPGIPGEVVAAIAGAVAAMFGEGAEVTSIRPAARIRRAGRGEWSLAGLLDNTRPF
jgi:hypothetical protein